MVVAPGAAGPSRDGAIGVILSPSITMAWLARNSPVRTLSTRPARITILFGACAPAVIAIPASVASTAAATTPGRLIRHHSLACEIESFKASIKTPHGPLLVGTRRV